MAESHETPETPVIPQENPIAGEPPARRARETPSLAWPILIIGAGVILLLSNLGMLAGDAGFLLTRLWPVVLIVLGIELLLGRRARWISALLALLVVAALIVLLVFGPPLPFLDPSTPSGEEQLRFLFKLNPVL